MAQLEPAYRDELVSVYHGDCLNILPRLRDGSVHAVVTDPPYGLAFMGRDWDKLWAVSPVGFAGREDLQLPSGHQPNATCRRCGGRQRGARRCRCSHPEWDHPPLAGSHAYQRWCERWAKECWRLLTPGGHLVAFGGTRTWHRLAVAIEDAGFEIRDSLQWIYGSGFPKSLNVAKALDKQRAGRTAELKQMLARAVAASGKTRRQINVECGFTMRFDVPYAKDPKGWGSSLPTLEQFDVICEVLGKRDSERDDFRAVLVKTYQVNGYEERSNSPSGIVTIGWAATPFRRELTTPGTEEAARWQGWGTALKPAHEPVVLARKPLTGIVARNVFEYGTGGLNIDACRVPSDGRPLRVPRGQDTHGKTTYGKHGPGGGSYAAGQTDQGRWPPNVLLTHAADCRAVCGNDCPVAALNAESGILRSGANPSRRHSDVFRDCYGHFEGSGVCRPTRGAESGGAARFFPAFRWQAKARQGERPRVDGRAHPTVKPLELMRWLVRLVTPDGGLVLDPFLGSGTTAEAARLEGFRCIGIEREADYLPLIRARLERRNA
jgi:DNA modification methylase